MNSTDSLQPGLRRIQSRSLVVGLAGLGISAVGGWFAGEQFFRSYLIAYLFWLGIALGFLPIVMLYHLTGGAWGSVIRRLVESGTRTLPLMALLFVPLLFGVHSLYEWARPERVGIDSMLQHKSLYLNVPFFAVRTLLYFVAWIVFAFYLNKWSSEQDRTGDIRFIRRFQLLSGPGILVYGLTVTFASIDWAMSLEARWFSTIYGMLFVVGQVLAAFAFVIPVLAMMAGHKPMADVLSPNHFNDLGNLMLTFVMLWAYIAFSQFLIIWSGNLTEEIPWYLRRMRNGWEWVAVLLLVFHFFVPFLLLLSRAAKRRIQVLSAIALAVMFMRLVDVYWLIDPAFYPNRLTIHWLDLIATIGIGGLWISTFVRQLRKKPLLPLQDPNLVAREETT